MFRTRNRNIVTAQTSTLATRTALTEDLGASIYLTEAVVVPFYSELFSALEQTHCTLVTYDSEWVTSAFYGTFLNSHRSCVLTALLLGCCMVGATWSCCHLGAHSVRTIQPRISLVVTAVQPLYNIQVPLNSDKTQQWIQPSLSTEMVYCESGLSTGMVCHKSGLSTGVFHHKTP